MTILPCLSRCGSVAAHDGGPGSPAKDSLLAPADDSISGKGGNKEEWELDADEAEEEEEEEEEKELVGLVFQGFWVSYSPPGTRSGRRRPGAPGLWQFWPAASKQGAPAGRLNPQPAPSRP